MTKEELDRLVKMLENADLDPWDDDRAIEDVLNLVRAWPVEEPASPWINVKDRLPKDGEPPGSVWVFTTNKEGGADVCFRRSDGHDPLLAWWEDSQGNEVEVTHWMYGPQDGGPAPPEELPIPVPPEPRTGPD